MRGKTDQQTWLLVLHPQDMISTHHPIRQIKPNVFHGGAKGGDPPSAGAQSP